MTRFQYTSLIVSLWLIFAVAFQLNATRVLISTIIWLIVAYVIYRYTGGTTK